MRGGSHLRELKGSKIRIKNTKKSRNNEFDTLGITMELEKSLSIGYQLEKERQIIRENKKKKIYRFIIMTIILLLILLIAIFFIHINKTYKLNCYTQDLIKSDSEIKIDYDKEKNLIFTPYNLRKKEGLIIYPSSGIEPAGYVGLSRKISAKGYKVIVIKQFMNYPFFSINKVDRIIKDNKKIDKWYLLAHHTSGEVSVRAASNNKKISGVVFLGTYPSGDDLKLINKPVMTIWGTKDGILDLTKFQVYKNNLPSNADFKKIIGANNSGFADVNMITGDKKARIENSIQQEITAKSIDLFINKSSKIK